MSLITECRRSTALQDASDLKREKKIKREGEKEKVKGRR